MKLSWLNTSEAHKQTNQAYKYVWAIWINARYNIKERELEKVDQTQTQGYVSRFELTAHVPAFTQKDFHYNVHTGLPTQRTYTEDLGKYNLRVHNSSLNKYNLYT